MELDEEKRKFTDCDKVREAIEKYQVEIAGDGRGVSKTPVIVRVHSKTVVDLTVVDLPGIVKVSSFVVFCFGNIKPLDIGWGDLDPWDGDDCSETLTPVAEKADQGNWMQTSHYHFCRFRWRWMVSLMTS